MSPTYRAIRLERFAESFRAATAIVDLPIEPPGPGQIAVENAWCGVNGIFDTQIARDAVGYVRIAPPTITGVEALGLVTAVGEGVKGFVPGDAVVTVRFRGGYRERNLGPADDFVKVPSLDRAWLALASTGVSAFLALHHTGEIKAGETVAISAAAGGLGHILVQVAKLAGCRVIAICGGPDKAAFVKSLGADVVIDHRRDRVAAVLAAECPRGIDVAVNSVGGGIFDAFLDHLADFGRLVLCGAATDLEGVPEIVTGPRIVHKLYYKAASVRGFMNGLMTAHWPAARAALFDLKRAGRLDVAFDPTPFAGLDQVYDAVEHLLSGRSMGKVMVDLRPPGHA